MGALSTKRSAPCPESFFIENFSIEIFFMENLQ